MRGIIIINNDLLLPIGSHWACNSEHSGIERPALQQLKPCDVVEQFQGEMRAERKVLISSMAFCEIRLCTSQGCRLNRSECQMWEFASVSGATIDAPQTEPLASAAETEEIRAC